MSQSGPLAVMDMSRAFGSYDPSFMRICPTIARNIHLMQLASPHCLRADNIQDLALPAYAGLSPGLESLLRAGCILDVRPYLIQVIPQDLGPGRMPELGHGLGLDLPDPLPGHAVDLADLVQRLGLTVGEPEPHRHDARLPFGQGVKHRA